MTLPLAVGVALVVVGVGIVGATVAWAYCLGHAHGLRRARAIVHAVSGHAGRLAPMPPEKAWVLCGDKIVEALDKQG